MSTRANVLLRRTIVLAVLGAIGVGIVAQPRFGDGPTRVQGGSVERDPAFGFPIGWYHGVQMRSSLPKVAADGMDSTMPYYTAGSTLTHAQLYLDQAAAAGVRVMLELPRDIVKAVDLNAIVSFVRTFETHPALMGWYLADEPSLTLALGPLSAANAIRVYDAIKAEDPDHPVTIALHHRENSAAYAPAMDMMMWNEYPCYITEPEFAPLRWENWLDRLRIASDRASGEEGFIPIIQAYGGTLEVPVFDRRHCSATEQRYMIYSAIQEGATGLFFWTQYRADPVWVADVLQPIVAEVTKLRPALARGAVRGLAVSNKDSVGVTTFRDPKTRSTYLIAINHGRETVSTRITLKSRLRTATRAWVVADPVRRVRIVRQRVSQTLGPFEVRVIRFP